MYRHSHCTTDVAAQPRAGTMRSPVARSLRQWCTVGYGSSIIRAYMRTRARRAVALFPTETVSSRAKSQKKCVCVCAGYKTSREEGVPHDPRRPAPPASDLPPVGKRQPSAPTRAHRPPQPLSAAQAPAQAAAPLQLSLTNTACVNAYQCACSAQPRPVLISAFSFS